MRSTRDYLILSCKGMMMGAADAVPGVSGGTIAFITGIYEELIDSIRQFNPEAVRILFREGPLSCWRYVNGNFLLALGLGILASLLTLSHLMLYLLDTHPIMIWYLGGNQACTGLGHEPGCDLCLGCTVGLYRYRTGSR